MKSTDDFHSIVLFLNQQLHCRRAYSLPIDFSQDNPTLTSKQESLKNITSRVKNYVEQHRLLSREQKQEALREVTMVRIRFKEVLHSEKNSHDGIFKKMKKAVYHSILKHKVVKNIKKIFSELPDTKSHLEFNAMLNMKKSISSQEILTMEEKDLAHVIAERLKKPIEKFHLNYNPFFYDVQEALEYSLQHTSTLSAECIKEFLLKAIEDQYASIEEEFTEEQLRHAEEELKLARHYAFLKETYEHDYSEYDITVLQEAIKKSREQSHSPEKSTPYLVLRHRMPGKGATLKDYEHLRQAVLSSVKDSEILKMTRDSSTEPVKSPSSFKLNIQALLSPKRLKSPKAAPAS